MEKYSGKWDTQTADIQGGEKSENGSHVTFINAYEQQLAGCMKGTQQA